jgi:thioredoxin reductase
MLGGRLDGLQQLKGPHERILDHKNYLERQLEVYGVEVHTGQEVTAEFVRQQAPDTVVVAVGSTPGAWNSEAAVSGSILGMEEIIASLEAGIEPQVGDELVIVGAQFQACEVAVHMIKLGKSVTMLNPGPESEFYMNGAAWPREMSKSWLRAKGMKLYHNVVIKQATVNEVSFETEYGVAMTLACDTVIQALPETRNRALFEEIKAVCDDVYAVGNCYSPGTIANATARGNLVARSIGTSAKTETTAAATTSGNHYSATATGIGDVTVDITVEDGKIVAATVDTSAETAGIGRELGEQFAQQILEKGEIDSVSGASVTSKAVNQALADCMKQAGLH